MAYREDLAYIHDAGHTAFTRDAAPALLELLRRHGLERGRVVDLGCGSGVWARTLTDAGYEVLGIDISSAMIALARRRAPRARFLRASFLTGRLPPCAAVTALGECFNYLFDRGNTTAGLRRLLQRIHGALGPGGLLVFDVAVPGRLGRAAARRSHAEGRDWAVLVHAEEDRRTRRLTRRITSFRKVGACYRRTVEVHRLRLWDPRKLSAQLRRVGFRVRVLRGYGQLRFAPGHVGFLARR
ncbi:MAG TPA: methyltransferase domain-containing protein [Candidatus Polarisedimenticolaceae bacterium]|nr:methyltransferase domain-containing protein [Candidatus Polarisedimenticolaceae bacterium]